MERLVKGDVVVIPFPFSDLSQAKRRPALVIAELDGDDVILCQITSQSVSDRYAIPVLESDFETGGMHQPSNVRPNRIFTADRHIVLSKIGFINRNKVIEIINSIISIIQK